MLYVSHDGLQVTTVVLDRMKVGLQIGVLCKDHRLQDKIQIFAQVDLLIGCNRRLLQGNSSQHHQGLLILDLEETTVVLEVVIWVVQEVLQEVLPVQVPEALDEARKIKFKLNRKKS